MRLSDRRTPQTDVSDQVPARLVIGFVGIIAVGALAGAGYLYYMGKDAQQMIGLVQACITGLLALLASTGRTQPHGTAADPVVTTPSPLAPAQDVNIAGQDAPVKVEG